MQMRRKLWSKDSIAAKEIFGNVASRYSNLKNKVGSQAEYIQHLDSMQTAMRFLQGPGPQKLLNNYTQLQGKLNQAADIKKYLKERQQYLKTQLQQLGLTKQLKQFEKDVYYYRAQVNEYKRMLDDPSLAEKKILQIVGKLPAFKDFFAKHSILSSMFRLPSNDPVTAAAPIRGLQTRASVQQFIVQRFGTDPDVRAVMQQNVQSAQAQINQLKEKIASLGGGSSDMDMPKFKPNLQKVKSFWNRIELGVNVQSVRGTNYFPVTSDLALSAGYKINDKSVAGIGMSYKMGWGQSIRNIKLTHEGVGLRSFADIKLKGSFCASGGFEYNYQKPFSEIQQVRNLDNWQQSALVGVSKMVSVNSKFFRQTKVQLLWDFLSYRQIPRAQPLKFRIGYNLK